MTSRSSKDGLQFLSDDHQVIFGLFDKVKAATNVQQKKEIVDKIVSTVSQHACIEEQYMVRIRSYF
jgi:hemerythrin